MTDFPSPPVSAWATDLEKADMCERLSFPPDDPRHNTVDNLLREYAAVLRAGHAQCQQEPVAWQFRQRSGVGKGPQSQAPWCDWVCIEREDYERYVREPSKLIEVRPLYAGHAQSSKVREALQECIDVLALCEHPCREDPQYRHEVAALGDRIGYGALMSSASATWRRRLKEDGAPVGGEFVAGPCQATVTRALQMARAALSNTSTAAHAQRQQGPTYASIAEFVERINGDVREALSLSLNRLDAIEEYVKGERAAVPSVANTREMVKRVLASLSDTSTDRAANSSPVRKDKTPK